MSSTPKGPNPTAKNGTGQHFKQVAAGVTQDLSALFPPIQTCAMVYLHSAGDIYFTKADGTDDSLTGLAAGLYPIQAQAILSGTTAKVTCFF
jgi:hypothetical protein